MIDIRDHGGIFGGKPKSIGTNYAVDYKSSTVWQYQWNAGGTSYGSGFNRGLEDGTALVATIGSGGTTGTVYHKDFSNNTILSFAFNSQQVFNNSAGASHKHPKENKIYWVCGTANGYGTLRCFNADTQTYTSITSKNYLYVITFVLIANDYYPLAISSDGYATVFSKDLTSVIASKKIYYKTSNTIPNSQATFTPLDSVVTGYASVFTMSGQISDSGRFLSFFTGVSSNNVLTIDKSKILDASPFVPAINVALSNHMAINDIIGIAVIVTSPTNIQKYVFDPNEMYASSIVSSVTISQSLGDKMAMGLPPFIRRGKTYLNAILLNQNTVTINVDTGANIASGVGFEYAYSRGVVQLNRCLALAKASGIYVQYGGLFKEESAL